MPSPQPPPSPPPAPTSAPLPAPTVPTPAPTSPPSDSKTGVIFGTLAGFLILLGSIVGFAIWRWRLGHHRDPPANITIEDTPAKKWPLSSLQAATNNFDSAGMLGKGGSAVVYKATLNGLPMAVKKLKNYDRAEFVKEVRTIGGIHHRNLVALRGYCLEGDHCILVYDLLPNGSLEDWLFGEGAGRLSWPKCVNIISSTAEAIAYLHQGCKDTIIHRDIKPGNILLDDNFTPLVSDFGLVRSTAVADTHVSTRIAGTVGYLAPEYMMTGQLTTKSDVYSFGVLMLVIISHRQAFSASRQDGFFGVVDRAYKAAEDNRLLDLVSAHFSDSYDKDKAKRLISIAFLCIQPAWQERPSMAHVVQMVQGDIEVKDLSLSRIQQDRQTLISGFGQNSSSSHFLSRTDSI